MIHAAIFFVAQPPLWQYHLCSNPFCTGPKLQPEQSLIIASGNSLGNETCACPEHFCFSISSVSKIPLWLHLTPDGLYWDVVRVFAHCPQDFSWHGASPSLLSGSVTPHHLQKPEERPSPGTQLCHKQLPYRIGGAIEIVFMLHELFKLFAGWK